MENYNERHFNLNCSDRLKIICTLNLPQPCEIPTYTYHLKRTQAVCTLHDVCKKVVLTDKLYRTKKLSKIEFILNRWRDEEDYEWIRPAKCMSTITERQTIRRTRNTNIVRIVEFDSNSNGIVYYLRNTILRRRSCGTRVAAV